MADLMAGPNAPLTKAFISCGWRCITVDWLLDPSHDLADERRQQSLSCQLEEVIVIAAVIDCSTKSRAREIPRRFEDGRPAPGPFRSEVYPDGLPTLSGRDAKRVDIDSKACNYVLKEIQKLRGRGGGSVRENPARSLRCMVDIRRGGYVELRAINGHLILAACTSIRCSDTIWKKSSNGRSMAYSQLSPRTRPPGVDPLHQRWLESVPIQRKGRIHRSAGLRHCSVRQLVGR